MSENEWSLPKRCIFSQSNSKLMIMIERVGVRPVRQQFKRENKTPLCYMYSRYLLFKVEVLRLTDLR